MLDFHQVSSLYALNVGIHFQSAETFKATIRDSFELLAIVEGRLELLFSVLNQPALVSRLVHALLVELALVFQSKLAFFLLSIALLVTNGLLHVHCHSPVSLDFE